MVFVDIEFKLKQRMEGKIAMQREKCAKLKQILMVKPQCTAQIKDGKIAVQREKCIKLKYICNIRTVCYGQTAA